MSKEVFADIAAQVFPSGRLVGVERLAGGVSADVHRLDVALADDRRRSVVLRVHGATHGGHGAQLEFELLRAVHALGLPAAEPLLVDLSGDHLADPYLLIEYVPGDSTIPVAHVERRVAAMARMLARIHGTTTSSLPELPERLDPLPELFDFLPEGDEWQPLRRHLETLAATAYRGAPCLLHGDFWPENILWRDGEIAAVLDWEDAAVGDPLSDLASARVELRYLYGPSIMSQFSQAYAPSPEIDLERLALWQIYVAAAAQRYMGQWRLEPAREAHMRAEALACVREAGSFLMGEGEFA